jgi:uncharacterized protein (DUF305 family)
MLIVILAACNGHKSESTNTSADSATANMASDERQRDMVSSSQSSETAVQQMHNAMTAMMNDMQTMETSGDPDQDFAMLMRRHHQAAIDMARVEIVNGKDEKLKAMAQKMIDDQQKEVTEFFNFLKGHQLKGNSNYADTAIALMSHMDTPMSNTSSIDQMFATMMVPHHIDGIEMAQAFLKVGKNSNMKGIANKIVQSQQKEVDELNAWLNSNKQS